VLINPENTSTAEAARRDMPEAARALGVTIEVLNASTSREIEAAFAVLVRNRAVALFVAADAFHGQKASAQTSICAPRIWCEPSHDIEAAAKPFRGRKRRRRVKRQAIPTKRPEKKRRV
jgi:hypothetical protein